jgi:hypothetical protein
VSPLNRAADFTAFFAAVTLAGAPHSKLNGFALAILASYVTNPARAECMA